MTPCLRPSFRGRITLKLGGKNIGIMLAGIWFVLTGLIPLFSISMANLGMIMSVLAVATGVVLLWASNSEITTPPPGGNVVGRFNASSHPSTDRNTITVEKAADKSITVHISIDAFSSRSSFGNFLSR